MKHRSSRLVTMISQMIQGSHDVVEAKHIIWKEMEKKEKFVI